MHAYRGERLPMIADIESKRLGNRGGPYGVIMGKQLQFHTLPEDMQMFLDFVQKHYPVVVTLKSSDSPKVTPVSDAITESDIMTLWNKALLDSLERKLIHRPGGSDYYRVDDSLPTLELSPSR